MSAYRELHLPLWYISISDHMVAVQNAALQNLQRQRVLNQALDGAFQRTRAVGPIIAFEEQQLFGCRRELDGDLAIGQQFAQIIQPQLNNVRKLLFVQRTEDDDVVHAIEKLRTEVLPQGFHDVPRGFLKSFRRAETFRLQIAGADIGRHNNDRILEIDRAAFGVREPAIIENLQQDIEDVRMRLFNFVKQDHAVWPATDRFGELAALVIADISRRRANQAGHGVFFHVFRHVNAHHGVLIVKEKLSQRPRQFGFAYSGGAKKNERANRLARIAQTGA